MVIIPPIHRRWNGGILDSPPCLSVRLSVRPSICRQGFRNFLKKLLAQFISYLAFTLMGWVSWPLYIFVFLASFRSSGGQIFGWNGVSGTFWKNYWLNSLYIWHLPSWDESLDPYSFLWVVIRAVVYCPHLWAQLVNINVFSSHMTKIHKYSLRI